MVKLAAEQQKLVRFLPWIHHSYLEKGKPAIFHPQPLADSHTIEELGLKMHDELKALPQIKWANVERQNSGPRSHSLSHSASHRHWFGDQI